LFFGILFFGITNLQSQNIVSGIVSSKETGEAVVGANVKVIETGQNTVSNNYGFYSLSLGKGFFTIVHSYTGFANDTNVIVIGKRDENGELINKQSLDIKLMPIDLSAIIISGNKREEKRQDNDVVAIDIPVKFNKKMPLLLGEVDIIKSAQLLPGVKGGTDGSSGFYVRGGGADQNLILLDGVPIYSQNHLFGFFSVFNDDAINSVQLYKGNFPARYGSRLASVLDVTLKEGNNNRLHGTASLGAAIGRFNLNGPIGPSKKTTFSLSARRSYIGAVVGSLANLISDDTQKIKTTLYFYDINAKLAHKINYRKNIYFSFYRGKDKYGVGYENETKLPTGALLNSDIKTFAKWSNTMACLRYTDLMNNGIFANYTLSYSNYKNERLVDLRLKLTTDTSLSQASIYDQFLTGLNDINARADYDYKPSANHHLRFGIGALMHSFNPGRNKLRIDFGGFQEDTTFSTGKNILTLENTAYIDDVITINANTKANIGLRLVNYATLGKNYFFAEPRIALNEQLDSAWIFRLSYALNNQPIHLLPNSNVGLPLDVWVPATKDIKPQVGHQFSAGTITNMRGGLQLTIDAYYRWLRNTIENLPGFDITDVNPNWQQNILQGIGDNYGLEVFLQKQHGKFTGWASYTLSYANRKTPGINNGNTYAFRYDQRHNFSSTFNYNINKRNSMGYTLVFGTGFPLTVPIGQYADIDGQLIYEYGGKNNYRMENTFRIDLNYVHFFRVKAKSWFKQAWVNASIYNVTARPNPFLYRIEPSQNGGNAITLTRVSYLQFFPSVSLNVSF